MPDAYTYIPKPTSSTYSLVTFQGTELFDDATVLYDDPNVFYDGTNPNAYIYVPKPTDGLVRGGMTRGLIIPLTSLVSAGQSAYTYVPKPTN